MKELERDRLLELEVRRDHDHTHSALTENALDPELPRDGAARLHDAQYRRRKSRTPRQRPDSVGEAATVKASQ
jgi:hypothetical protein